MSEKAIFTPDLFAFLGDLSKNNDREWFNANRDRYEDSVKIPAMTFIAAMGPGLKKISPHFQAIPSGRGGSLFRIHRDTRFSRDKSPYKTNTGMHFRHESAGDAHAPGFYVHLSPGEVFFGAGLWKPDGPSTQAVREHIAANEKDWMSVRKSLKESGLTLKGESLKRPPRGFDASHPLIEDLKLKDFLASANLSEEVAVSPDFLDRITGLCRDSAPLMAFLCRALDLPF